MTDLHSLEAFADRDGLLATIRHLENDLTRTKTAAAAARANAKTAASELADAETRFDVLSAATGQDVPKWVSPKKPAKSEAVAVAVLSDCHWDEIVRPEEVDYTNAYNREIAEMRLHRFVEKTIELSRDYVANVNVTGLVLLLGGDLVSGDIHEELKETNEGTSLETAVHWSGELAAAIGSLADHFGNIHVAAVVGNHGRRTRKPRSKGRVHDNFDWLIAHSVSTMLGSDDRITWQIPETADTIVKVHGTRILLTHGDKVTGGSGIGGIWPPIKRLQARLQTNPSTAHDLLVMGHWHQLTLATTAKLLVNGSLKGWDEYAATSAFEWEEPRQAWFLVTPEHGVTMSAPIFVADREAEGW